MTTLMAGFSPRPALSAAGFAAREKPLPKRRRKKATLSQLILRAAAEPQSGGGASLAAIKKVLQREGFDVRKNKARIRALLRHFLRKGILLRVSGSGVSGSFRLRVAGGAPAAEKRKAAARGRKRAKKKSAAAEGPGDSSGKVKPAAARPDTSSSSPGEIRGTVATRRKQILDDIIKGTFLMER